MRKIHLAGFLRKAEVISVKGFAQRLGKKKASDRYMLIISGNISLLERTTLCFATVKSLSKARRRGPGSQDWKPELHPCNLLCVPGRVPSLPSSSNARKHPMG